MATTTGTTEGALRLGGQLSPMYGQLPDEMQRCIENCLACATVCEQTIAHCLAKGGKHAAPEHVRLLIDCAELCRTSATLMTRGSDFHRQHCALCADVCHACEESCEEFPDDPQMKACADACRTCAGSCRRMGANA